MVGILMQLTRSLLTPQWCRVSLMISTVRAMHFFALGCGVNTIALPAFSEIRDL